VKYQYYHSRAHINVITHPSSSSKSPTHLVMTLSAEVSLPVMMIMGDTRGGVMGMSS